MHHRRAPDLFPLQVFAQQRQHPFKCFLVRANPFQQVQLSILHRQDGLDAEGVSQPGRQSAHPPAQRQVF